MNTSNLSGKSAAFLAKNPTLLGTYKGVSYYEHPTKGDDHPMIEITADGRKLISDYWDMSSVMADG